MKKLKGELEKQIKANADALLEQDTKLTTYTAHYTALLDKQAMQTAEMQKAHGDALNEIHMQMKTQMEAHKAEMEDVKGVLHEERVAHKNEMDDVRAVLKETQLRQLGFAAQAEEFTRSLAAFGKAMELQMLTTKEDVRLLRELKGDAGYVNAAASALAEQQTALRNKVAHLRSQVTAFATAVHTGLREEARCDEAASQFQALEDSSTELGLVNNQDAGSVEARADILSAEEPHGDVLDRRAREALQRAWATWCGRRELGDRGARGRRRTAEPVAQRVEGDDWSRPLQQRDVACDVGLQRSEAAREHMQMHSIRGATRNGHKGTLCGAKGILCVDTFVSVKTYSSAVAQAQADQFDPRIARRDGQGKFESGKLRNSASTSGIHAVWAAILLLAASMDGVHASAMRCCSTVELRRFDRGPAQCFDRATLRCYDGAAFAKLLDGAGRWRTATQGCRDAGEEFWQCARVVGTARAQRPSPAFDATLAELLEPEPSPRLVSSEDYVSYRTRSETIRKETATYGGSAINIQWRGTSWFARCGNTRCNHAEWRLMEPFTIQRGRRLRWYIGRKAWKRLMRSLRGNTVEEMFTVALWNAREFHADANPTREASRNKMKWLMQRLEAERPDACFILEMMGGHGAFTARPWGLRACARRAGYVVRWIVGEGGSNREKRQGEDTYTNGIAVLVNKATCDIERYVRIEERVVGTWLRGRNAKAQVGVRVAALHGLHHEGTSSFRLQLQAMRDWAEDHSQGGQGCLVVGDFNYVASENWRSSHVALSFNDICFKNFLLQPGTEYIGPFTGKPMVVWTRKGGESEEGGDTKGCGSMLDGAVAIGRESGHWRRAIVEFAFEHGATATGAFGKPLSDHAWLSFSRRVPILELRGEKRPLPALPRADERIETAYRDRVRQGDILEDILAARRSGTQTVSAATSRLREAATQVVAEAWQRRREHPLETAHRWRRWLQEAYALRHGGYSPHEVRGGLFNFHSRLWLIRERYEAAGDDVCWAKIIARCRRRWNCANQRVRRKQLQDDLRLKELSLRIMEGKGSTDLAQTAMKAWDAIRPPRSSLALDKFHPGDITSAAPPPVSASEDPEAFLKGLAKEGDRMVQGFGSTPPIIEAFKAFCNVFCPAYETLRGRDGGAWELCRELTFPVFLQVLKRVPRGKAVGYGGFSIELLLNADRCIKEAFYECLMADLRGGVFPASWRRVIYVLLTKPLPNNPALISERREIALMAQDMKLIMHMVRATAYRLITGRLRLEQCGWLPGYGTVDAGLPLAAVIQQAQRLRQSIWILYVDLATFFPRIDREALTVAEVLIGLPPEVIDLVGKIYGAGRAVAADAVECQFDSAIGLSATFRNHMGALMGEVLSPDRAKIMLNSILWAIKLHVHGVALFGFGEDEEGCIRAIASLAYADDWAGTFSSAVDLQRAWAIWSVWVPISGSKLGIKLKLKTVVTGVLRDETGAERNIDDPNLQTIDGVRVPMLSMDEAYKHLGVLRAAVGGDDAAADSLRKQLRVAIGRVARMHRPSREDMVLVTNGLFQGLAGFKCSTVYYSFEWMEGIEREWRRVFNRKMRRDASSPACTLYEGGGGTSTGARRHLWAIGCSAFYAAFTRALADRADTSQRAAARSTLALSLSRWGAQGDPRLFSWRHLEEALERRLRGKHKYLGDIFMFISSLVQGEEDVRGVWENWRWAAEPDECDPLHAGRPHFRALESVALFDTEKTGGLGIEPAPLLLEARIRAAGQMATWGAGDEGPRWLTFEEARRLYPWLSTKARAEWERTTAGLEERLTDVVAPEREAVRAWNQRGLLDGGGGCLDLSLESVKGTSTDAVYERTLHDAIRDALGAIKGGRVPARVDWESLIRCTFKGLKEPRAAEWCVGGGDARADAEGGRVFLDIDCEEEPRGGEASWLKRADVDEQGFLVDWMSRASAMRAAHSFDDKGFLCSRQGERLEQQHLGHLDPAVQLVARARLALGEVEVLSGDGEKRHETHVQLTSQRALWERLTTWSARVQATRIYTLDGGWRDVKVSDESTVKIATRAAIDHEGRVLGGRICEADFHEDNYIAELAAQLDALTDAVARGSEERIIIIFDATSPVRAMLRFGRLGARARGDRLAAELLEHFERLRRRVAVLVLLWQTSHVGEPTNEWADVMCDKFGLDDDHPIPRGRIEFASLTFPRHVRSAQEYAMQRMNRIVAARLRRRVKETVLWSDEEHVQLLHMSPEASQLCDEVAARRCQYVDQPYADARVKRLLDAEKCPFGCLVHANGWRQIHPAAVAGRRTILRPRLAQLLSARLGTKPGEMFVASVQEELDMGGADVQAGDTISAGGRWFARAECKPTWWHFQFECTGPPLVTARKAYALQAVEARRCMVELQVGKELVPHSQLDDLILLIHQGMQGWVAVDGAEGSIAQRQCLQNRVQRGERDAWETEQWRAAAAGRVRVSGSGADKSSRWRVALTEMVLRGCRQQQLGKDHCEKGRSAFWARLADLRLLGKVFGALKRTLLEASVKRLAALGELRAADEYVSNLEQADGYAKRRLRKEVEKLQVALGEEAAPENPLGAWLLLRAWLAWRTVLARGGGRSGRRVLHGAGRDRLREGLWQVAFGEQREMHTPRIQLAELRLARVRAWRRWLCLGGWGAFHMTCARIARARRSRLLAAQRDGMRRWAARADGRVWHILSDYEIEERFELAHEGLRSLLTTKQILSAGEWKGLGIHHLRLGHYVRVGQGSTEMLYGPGEVASQHTLSGDAAEDVGEVIVLDIAPRGNTQQKKRRRQEVACSRREVQRRVAMGPVRAGVEADDGGRWAVRGIRAVRRHEGRRGRPLDVLVEWEGEDSDGDLWEESWVSVTELTPDLRAEARKLESDLFGPRPGPTVSRRAERRAAAAQRQERERDAQQWRARLRDRAPSGPGSVRSSTD